MTEFEQREILKWFTEGAARHIVDDQLRDQLADLANPIAAMTGGERRFESVAGVDAYRGQRSGERPSARFWS